MLTLMWVDCREQSSVDTALTHSGHRLGLSCTVLLDSRQERVAETTHVDGSPPPSETDSRRLAFSDR